jgi:hypothetical protein
LPWKRDPPPRTVVPLRAKRSWRNRATGGRQSPLGRALGRFRGRTKTTLALLAGLVALALLSRGGLLDDTGLNLRPSEPGSGWHDRIPDSVTGRAYVRDGDTIEVGSVAVRLQGLHCPEADEPGGSIATSAMRRLVRGASVTCSLTGERTYDRIVGRCHVGEIDLAAALISERVCARCPRYDPWMRYLLVQRRAGGWNGTLPPYC